MSDLKTPNGWPSQGEQPDGSWIEYIFYPNTHKIRTFVTHDDYAAYLLKRRERLEYQINEYSNDQHHI